MRSDQVKILIKVENPDSIDTRLSIESNISGQLNFTLSTEKNADTVRLLTLTGLNHEAEEQITAYYTQDDGTKIAVGYLNTISYNAQNKKLIIVPVNNKFTPNETEIENYLQNTYKTAVTFWGISLSDPLEIDFERNKTKGLDTDLPGVAAYTKEMNKIKRALKKRQDYNPDAYYLFLIKKSEDGKKACPATGGNGIMPFNRHFGFIFLENDKNLSSNPEKLQHTIAHELGHSLSRNEVRESLYALPHIQQ